MQLENSLFYTYMMLMMVNIYKEGYELDYIVSSDHFFLVHTSTDFLQAFKKLLLSNCMSNNTLVNWYILGRLV